MSLIGRKGPTAEERDMGRKLRAGLAAEDRASEAWSRSSEGRAADERRSKADHATSVAMVAANAAADDMGLSAAKNNRAADLLDEAARLEPSELRAKGLREQAAHFRGMKGY